MPGSWRIVEWNARQIANKIMDGSRAAIDETTSAAASQAASMRSGSVANITSEPATGSGSEASGRWGAFPEPGGDPFYELFAEVGTPFQTGDNAKRRAADSEYAQLADRIRAYGA